MRRFYIATCVMLVTFIPAKADPKPATKTEAITVPFELLKTRHMAVNIKINGKGPYRVIFDTGAPVTLLNNKVAKEAGVFPKGHRPPLFALFGSAGQFKIKSLDVGGVKAEDISTVVMDHPTVSLMARALGPIEGIVGFSFFARYRTTIDYQKRTMTFEPSDYRPPDTMKKMMETMMKAGTQRRQVLAPAGQWGFRVAKKAGDKKDGVDVSTVMKNSAAAKAGLQAGDRLLTLDGRWTDTVKDCYAAASHVDAGESVDLVVLRDGKKVTLRVKVRRGL